MDIKKLKLENNELKENSALIKTIVTSEFGASIAKANNIEVMDVLTGFKFIGEKIRKFEETNSHTYLFGYEESYGYLVGTHARDKDGVVASVLIAEMAAFYYSKGLSLYEGLVELYNKYGKKKYDSKKLEKQIEQLMMDDDVTNKKGIYSYLLINDEKYLSIRAFTDSQKRAAYEKQKGICPLCKGDNKKKKWEYEEMEGDHLTPWSVGGKTSPDNLQMLCKDCNRRKSGK